MMDVGLTRFYRSFLILIGFSTIDVDKVFDEWRAMYPGDPARRTALRMTSNSTV